MNQTFSILVINPGSTSTKIALYENERELYKKSISHSVKDLEQYKVCTDQADFRQQEIMHFLEEISFSPEQLDVVVARGGALPPIDSGAYLVTDQMVHILKTRPAADHASNVGAVIAHDMSQKLGIPAYIYDGITVTQMQPIAQISGIPQLPRLGGGHPLNQRAVAIKYAQAHNRRYEDITVIVAHLGGGISLGLHHQGRIIDVLVDEESTFSPERAGRVYSMHFLNLVLSGKYTPSELKHMLRGNGGLAAHLGTNNAQEVEQMIANGDEHAKLVYEAMAYQIAKNIGELSTVVSGNVDAILITGGLAHSSMLTDWIISRVSFLAPVLCYPGEYEMEALALGALRVMRGEETAKSELTVID